MTQQKSRLINEILVIIVQQLFDRSNTTLPISVSPSHINMAIEQGIGGLFFQLLSNVVSLPSSLLTPLQSVWMNQMGGALLRGQILDKYWPDPISPPLIIKGIDLEENLYAPLGFTLGTRTSSDWDLLIPEPMYSQVTQEWTQQFGPALEPKSVRLTSEAPHELGFYIEGFLFEVHKDPAPQYFTTLNGNYIWDHRIKIESSWGQIISKPSEIDRLVIWLVNYSKSGGLSRLLDWIDFILILNSLTHAERQQVIHTPHHNSQLREHELHLVASEVVYTIRHTPLYRLINQPIKPQSFEEQVHFDFTALLKSLNRYASPMQVALHQVKYCHPQLRAEYIRRALIKVSNSMTSYPAT